VPSVQRPRGPTGTGRPPNRYPISLELRYKAKDFPVEGFGQTVMMSSQDIVFAPDNGLKPGMAAEIVRAWPFLLDNRIRLQLVLQVMITGTKMMWRRPAFWHTNSTPPGRGADPAGTTNKSPHRPPHLYATQPTPPRTSGRAVPP
jgi:hypothetical protein